MFIMCVSISITDRYLLTSHSNWYRGNKLIFGDGLISTLGIVHSTCGMLM